MARKIGIDVTAFLPNNMMKYGNTGGLSIPILLSEYYGRGREYPFWMVAKNSLVRFRWRFDMGHTYCYNLVIMW